MWKRSYVATTVALGGTVEDALGSLVRIPGDSVAAARGETPDLGAGASELVEQLRAAHRATRAAALAKAVRDIVFAIDEGTLR